MRCPPLPCRASPPQVGRSDAAPACSTSTFCGEEATSQSPHLWGRWPAGQRGVPQTPCPAFTGIKSSTIPLTQKPNPLFRIHFRHTPSRHENNFIPLLQTRAIIAPFRHRIHPASASLARRTGVLRHYGASATKIDRSSEIVFPLLFRAVDQYEWNAGQITDDASDPDGHTEHQGLPGCREFRCHPSDMAKGQHHRRPDEGN